MFWYTINRRAWGICWTSWTVGFTPLWWCISCSWRICWRWWTLWWIWWWTCGRIWYWCRWRHTRWTIAISSVGCVRRGWWVSRWSWWIIRRRRRILWTIAHTETSRTSNIWRTCRRIWWRCRRICWGCRWVAGRIWCVMGWCKGRTMSGYSRSCWCIMGWRRRVWWGSWWIWWTSRRIRWTCWRIRRRRRWICRRIRRKCSVSWTHHTLIRRTLKLWWKVCWYGACWWISWTSGRWTRGIISSAKVIWRARVTRRCLRRRVVWRSRNTHWGGWWSHATWWPTGRTTRCFWSTWRRKTWSRCHTTC